MTTMRKVTIYWKTRLLTDKRVNFNKPDIVIWNATEHTAQLIDVPLPQDYIVVSQTANKITKYKDLKIKIQKFWNLEKATIVPVVIGALEYTRDSLATHLVAFSDYVSVRILQKIVLLGTAHILRNFLY